VYVGRIHPEGQIAQTHFPLLRIGRVCKPFHIESQKVPSVLGDEEVVQHAEHGLAPEAHPSPESDSFVLPSLRNFYFFNRRFQNLLRRYF
jgi:hypothetical protein